MNFREEKTLLGVGEAQVRNPDSAEACPPCKWPPMPCCCWPPCAFEASSPTCCRPQMGGRTSPRLSTQQAMNQLRAEVWGRGLGLRISPTSRPLHPHREAGEIPSGSPFCCALCNKLTKKGQSPGAGHARPVVVRRLRTGIGTANPSGPDPGMHTQGDGNARILSCSKLCYDSSRDASTIYTPRIRGNPRRRRRRGDAPDRNAVGRGPAPGEGATVAHQGMADFRDAHSR